MDCENAVSEDQQRAASFLHERSTTQAAGVPLPLRPHTHTHPHPETQRDIPSRRPPIAASFLLINVL